MELRNMFCPAWYAVLAKTIAMYYPKLDEQRFVRDCTLGIKGLALNQRLRRTTEVLQIHLQGTYEQKIRVLSETIKHMKPGYTNLVFPDFVGLFGQKHFDLSMQALEEFTRFGSSEFAIREFLKNDFNRTVRVMRRWADDPDHHVRRLASEGSRPRLPWSFKLDAVITEPRLTKPILDALQKDDSLYVRKSVANHLNDISKFAPDYMMDLCRSWDATDERTAWIIRHASRSLIKKGDQASMALLNFEKNARVRLNSFRLTPHKLRIGQSLQFSFELASGKKTEQKLAVDYAVHYQKQRGRTVKVFKLKEFSLPSGASRLLTKEHAFADLSTRRHFPGKHLLVIQVNGKVLHSEDFELLG